MISLGFPVEASFPPLKQYLSQRNEVVLEAPPGAGKTTLVPLSLMDEVWLSGQKILMLEPRRIAAKSAAHRMAQLLGETPGQRIGYRMRLDTKVSHCTQVEVITEGILTRMLQHDPSLEGVGLVIFDEFHERSLDSDLALSLCLKGRELFRDDEGIPPLKLLVMSATLDGEATSTLLGNAPIVRSEGKAFPVDIIYGQASQPRERIVDRMVSTIKQAVQENPESSVLAFLPGQGEIHRCHEALSRWLSEKQMTGVHLRPLFGNLSIEAQQAAIAPLSGLETYDQKVVLATNIAETSLTIEGVDVVVDSGLARESRFTPATGMAGLRTLKISQASSVQRAGRAGRIRPGKCYRLWSESQQQQLAQQSTPEILTADLAPLVLQLLQWGVNDPAELPWMDEPPTGAWQQAMALLESLGAVTTHSTHPVLTEHGKAMSTLPVHPRLAHCLMCGIAIGQPTLASQLAALLSERDPFSRDHPDIAYRLGLLKGDHSCPRQHQGWLYRTQQLVQQFQKLLNTTHAKSRTRVMPLLSPEQQLAYLLVRAYPDRVARKRHSGGYQLSNGRSAQLPGSHSLNQQSWLAVAEVSAGVGGKGDMIRSAVMLDQCLFDQALADLIRHETIAEWDKKSNRFIAEKHMKVGALVLERSRLKAVPEAAKQAALIGHIRKEGLRILPWKSEHRQWCARVEWVRQYADPAFPQVNDQSLLNTLEDWLAPYLNGINTLQDFKKLNLGDIFNTLLSWEQQQYLKSQTPTRLDVPSGSSIAIDYTESPPVLAVKLQEMFGCEQTPTVLNGKVSLLIHLLSPAGRPLQITQDLAGFWRSSYHDVKKDMKGRYPKHPWPDDPLKALPTRWTKSSAKHHK